MHAPRLAFAVSTPERSSDGAKPCPEKNSHSRLPATAPNPASLFSSAALSTPVKKSKMTVVAGSALSGSGSSGKPELRIFTAYFGSTLPPAGLVTHV